MSIVYSILDNAGLKWAFLVIIMIMPLASLLTWAERRQSAMMQDRLGPNRANIGPIKLKGILHFVADALKMIAKEDFIPGNVHKGLFALAPILALAPVLIAFAIIPFGPTIYPHALAHPLDTYALATNASDPQFADAYFNLAMAHEQAGEQGKARPCWRKYLEIEPTGTWAEIARKHL